MIETNFTYTSKYITSFNCVRESGDQTVTDVILTVGLV